MAGIVLTEEDLHIRLPADFTGRKFDDEASHGLSHCMKAVDFIVETPDRLLFIECKDPDHPRARVGASNAFVEKFLGGQIDNDLKTKYRDSWLYEAAEGRADKPIYYLVLIAAKALSDAELLIRTEALKRQLPVEGPARRLWRKPFVAGCAVMNFATWNRVFPHMPVSRTGAAP